MFTDSGDREAKPPAEVTMAEKPKSQRDAWLQVGLFAAGAAVVCLFAAFEALGKSDPNPHVVWGFFGVFAVAAAWVAKALITGFAASSEPMTPQEEQKFSKATFGNWIARYSVALGIVCAAFALLPSSQKPIMPWVVGVGLLFAAYLARELVLWVVLPVLGIAVASWLIGAIAGIPVSVAIIIGALIIASAIRR